MPELRQNLATKEWVIIATERAQRPEAFANGTRAMTHLLPPFVASCPFCPGNEIETPEDVLTWPASGPWQVRVFPNSYPALSRYGEREQLLQGIHRKLNGVGYHEVIAESPLHNVTPALMKAEELALTLKAFQTRGREIMDDRRIEQIYYFKNHGPAAGGSIEHPHSQILALPMVPSDTRRRIEEVRRTYDDTGVCPYCRVLREEAEEGTRLIEANEHFVAFVPYAAVSPFHVWILPRRHGPTFLDQNIHELNSLAAIMRSVFARIYVGLRDPDFNYIIRSAPNRDTTSAYLHWYVSVMPRVTKHAGFELGSGMSINPALPEESARFLRSQPSEVAVDPVEVEVDC